MIALRPGSGAPPPGPAGVVMVPSFLGTSCPHQFDETAHRTVRLARRLTFREVVSSNSWRAGDGRRTAGPCGRDLPGATRRKPMSDLQAIADRVQIEALRGEATDAAM